MKRLLLIPVFFIAIVAVAQRIIEAPGQGGSTGGPGGGLTNAFNPVVVITPFSATPTFTAPNNTDQGFTFKMTLTGNVTSSTLTGLTNGQWVGFIICQDGPTGSHSFVWPTNVVGGPTISTTLNSEPSTCYPFGPFMYDGTNAYTPWQITAGATGALIRNATNVIDIDTTIVPRLASANVWTAAQTFSKKFTIGEAALAAAGTSDNLVVSLGATQILHGCYITHTAAFAGGGLTGVTVSIGNTTSVDQFCPVLDVNTAPSNTGFEKDGGLGKRTKAAENVNAHFICAGGNCSVATTGSLDVTLWIENMP